VRPPARLAGTFPPIADYGFLSDRESVALVASSGAVEWLCLPRPDSPSVFGSILDRSAGRFLIAPAGTSVPAGRRYLPGTMVLETTWQTRNGWLVVRDALLIGPWYESERHEGYWRTPGDDEAEHILLRTIKCVGGSVDVEVICEPSFDYGRVDATWKHVGTGYEEAVARGGEADPELRISTSLRLGLEARAAQAFTTMTEGDSAFVALAWGETPPPADFDQARSRLWRTADFWRRWLIQGQFPDHPWRAQLQRSALTLKGLTFAPTGALLAAPTTSLPESPGGERNWDYRYSWVRDSTFGLWALYTLGFDREADGFFYFIAEQLKDGDRLGVMYGVAGEKDIPESTLGHLEGYEGSRPVRVGNVAYSQDQNDVWGALLDSVWLHAGTRERLPDWIWPLLKRQVEAATFSWQQPDRGIWEVRGEPQHFTSSKVMCWVACDRGARLAEVYDEPEIARSWRQVADRIREDVLANGVDPNGVLTQSYGSKSLDASVLLAVLFGFLEPSDPRAVATTMAVAEGLAVDGVILRYRTDETDDGLEGEEGAFTMCSFWLVSALALVGEKERARSLLERLLNFASPLGLYAEEIDPSNGRHLGNFPQAFTHLALINAVVQVLRAEGAIP
jgi:alpha,alpha-trehalase